MKIQKIPQRGKYCKSCPCLGIDPFDKKFQCLLFRTKEGYVTLLEHAKESLDLLRCDDCLEYKPIIQSKNKELENG